MGGKGGERFLRVVRLSKKSHQGQGGDPNETHTKKTGLFGGGVLHWKRGVSNEGQIFSTKKTKGW